MEKGILKARTREEIGSAASRRLRRAGELPAVLGGGGKEAAALAVQAFEFEQAHGAGNRIVTLDFGKEKVDALIKEIQLDPLGESVVHVDFDRVVAGQTVDVEVRLEYFGEPEDTNTVLQTRLDTVTVTCLPGKIPSHVEVDVREMQIGDEIRLKELTYPSGVKLVTDEEEICVVLAAAEAPPEEEEEEVVEAAAEDQAEPEVIGKKKEDEEEEAKD
jgi:large subunit ribosomal protein L25